MMLTWIFLEKWQVHRLEDLDSPRTQQVQEWLKTQ
jgi:hypothetical protein